MKSYKKYETYCTGCGLCHSTKNVQFNEDEKGFNYPSLTDKETTFCSSVCPASGKIPYKFTGQIWGNAKDFRIGHSSDPEIRTDASSGGIITTLCIFLLENHLVDRIIQTRRDGEKPYRNTTVISRTKEDVISCVGSRYSISSPLMNILQIIKPDERYAFVGKPCDVVALRNFARVDSRISSSVIFYLSFFCAGEPSEEAQKNLVATLGCSSLDDCQSLNYRGNGWPGFATAMNTSGDTKQITYDESWGKILGRDVRKACRTCIDGTGDAADIACGDAWYLTPDGKPDFSEHEGRNLIFARTAAGKKVLDKAIEEKYITVEDQTMPLSDVQKIQNYQYTRKATLSSMLAAYRVCGMPVPDYRKDILREYGKHADMKTKFKRFAGTVKRHLQGKI